MEKTPSTNKKSGSAAAKSLQDLLEDSLKDIYWAEKALTKALPKMSDKATSERLKNAIESHLSETEGQISRLEQVFEIIGTRAEAKKCDAMEGLIEEANGIIEETESGPVRDAGIIAACQKVEHYEIASYGTMVSFANMLGLSEAAELLEETLNEEKSADEKLSLIAESEINVEAMNE